MERKQTGNPNVDLIALMGKKSTQPAQFRSVIALHDNTVKTGSDRAIAYAKRAIAISLGIHTKELLAADVKKCKSDIDKAKRINKDLPVVQIAEGCYHYYCMKKYTKALECFNRAYEKDPENYKALFYSAMVYKTQGDCFNMQTILDKLDKFIITNPLGLTNIGLCYDYLHEFDKALHYHKEAIRINPEWEAAYLNEFRTLLLKNKDTKEARILLKSIITPKEKHLEYQIILDIYEENYSGALKKVISGKPRDFDVRGEQDVYLGNIYNLMGHNVNAQKHFSSALKKLNSALVNDPDNTDVQNYIAMIEAKRGNNTRAIKECRKSIAYAIKIRNKILESDMILNLAKIYTILKMYDEAIDQIKVALSCPSLFSIQMLYHDPVWKPLLSNGKLKAIIQKYAIN